MKKTQTVPTFHFIGGHPCLNFVNSEIISRGKPKNLLLSFSHLVAWLVQANLLEESMAEAVRQQWDGTPLAVAVWQQALDLRQVLRAVVVQIVAGEAVNGAQLKAINDLLRQQVGYTQLQLEASGFVRQFVQVVEQPAQLLIPLAEAAADLLCEADFSLVKRCENPKCIRYFYDNTKNHSRRWCSMEACGNRAKVAAYYQRKKSGN